MCKDETDLAGAFTPLSSVTSGSMVSFSGFAGIGVRDPHTKQPCANIFKYQIIFTFHGKRIRLAQALYDLGARDFRLKELCHFKIHVRQTVF